MALHASPIARPFASAADDGPTRARDSRYKAIFRDVFHHMEAL